MTENKNKHITNDQNFKNLILDYPRESLEFFAEKEAQDITASTRIIPIRQEQLKDRLGDRFYETDTPLLAEWPDGKRKAVLFILEEESAAYRFSIYRLGRYCLQMAELLETDRIVPVVIFLHSGSYPSKLSLGGDYDTYLNFHYIVCDFRKIPAEKYMDSSNIVARLNLPNMAYNRRNPENRIEIYARAQEGLIELENDTEKRLKYIEFIDFYANLNKRDYHQYREKYLPESLYKEEIMGLLKIERNEGIREGIQKGFCQGEMALLKRQILRRFGSFPVWASERLEKADKKDLEIWADRILDAVSIEDIFMGQVSNNQQV